MQGTDPMIRHTLLALALLLAPVVVAADDLHLVEPGKLTWGSSPTFTPFEFMVDGKAKGFDVDLMDPLAKRIGLSSTMMGMEFKGAIPPLPANRIYAAVS